jgi:hypothetical protein
VKSPLAAKVDVEQFRLGKLKKVTFKYGFPQYAKPAAAASKQLGFKVGVEHETVVLTRGKDGSDRYAVVVNVPYLKQAAANAVKYGWKKEKQSAGVQKYMPR